MSEGEEPAGGLRPTIDERIAELEAESKTKEEMVLILYNEGYSTREIMARKLPLKALKTRPESDDSIMGAIAGTAKGSGYLDEFKTMIRSQISRSRELTEVCSDVGLGVLLAGLSKSGVTMDEFQRIALKREGLREALVRAGETAFKALEYYQSDLVGTVEGERDEARAYASLLESRLEELMKYTDPRIRMERMIQTYLLSGGSDTEVLTSLLDKWLAMEVTNVKLDLMR